MDLISKYDLIERIVNTEDESLLQQIKHLLESEESESWEDLDPALKASITRGVRQADKGLGKPHSAVIKQLRKKYPKQ